MASEAGQIFDNDNNRLWIDLHTCKTWYAEEVFETKVNEAYTYGLKAVEFIYGTPDRYEGSIEQCLTDRCASGHGLIEGHDKIHAGVVVKLRHNPSPAPRDENMCFSPIKPQHDNARWRNHSYHFPLYPLRMVFGSAMVAERLDVTPDLVLAIARDGFRGATLPDAERRTEWDPEWRKNLTTWHFTQRDVNTLEGMLSQLSEEYRRALADREPNAEELAAVIGSVRKVVPEEGIPRQAKSLLTRLRKQHTV